MYFSLLGDLNGQNSCFPLFLPGSFQYENVDAYGISTALWTEKQNRPRVRAIRTSEAQTILPELFGAI